jgi:uncharacterized integral membrane protein
MRYVTGALAAIVLIAIVAFALQNLAAVEVSFLTWSVNVPKVVLILATYVLGMLSGWGVVELVRLFLRKA